MNELTCVHGIGHSADVHGCDGCCHELFKTQIEYVINLIEILDSHSTHSELCNRQHWLAERLTTYLKGENK
jgi:hypothetical protein